MGLHREVVTVTSAVGGAGTATATHAINGFLWQIDYIKVDFADGVDVTFNMLNSISTDAILTVSNLNAATSIFPRGFATNPTGTAETIGTNMIAVFGRPSVTVASAGDAKTGTFVFTWAD